MELSTVNNPTFLDKAASVYLCYPIILHMLCIVCHYCFLQIMLCTMPPSFVVGWLVKIDR